MILENKELESKLNLCLRRLDTAIKSESSMLCIIEPRKLPVVPMIESACETSRLQFLKCTELSDKGAIL